METDNGKMNRIMDSPRKCKEHLTLIRRDVVLARLRIVHSNIILQ